MTKPALTLYDKIRDLIEKEGYVISSEQGYPDSQMYLIAYNNQNIRVQVNVRNQISPPASIRKQFGLN